MRLLIQGGRVIDPASGTDDRLDLMIEDSKIVKIGESLKEAGAHIISAKGKIVTPGLIDMHCHLREPGEENKETFATGTRSAAMGGITTVACMANTKPVIDTQAGIKLIHYLREKQGVVSVYPIAAVTKGMEGNEITEFGELKEVGAVALSDDGKVIMNADKLRCALDYARMFDLAIISHCEDVHLSGDGVMNEGKMSTVLGLPGIPAVSEEAMIARDILLAEFTKGRLHVAHISTDYGVELVRQAKGRGVRVTTEATPHHFTLTDEAVRNYDTHTKMNPPLRAREDVEAVRQGLADDTIDVIATDHAPHTMYEKEQEFQFAPFGVIGFETMVPLVMSELVAPGILELPKAVEKLTVNPARILGIDKGYLKVGGDADVTIIDPDLEVTYTREMVVSKSHNSPFYGRKMKGWPVVTIVAGKIVMQDRQLLV
jgi:dihydroorotase